MTRTESLAVLAAGALALVPAAARAAGLIRFRNVSFDEGVTVEVRVGASLDAAALYGTRKLVRSEEWEVDTAGSPAWWRRESAPGSNDGRYTDWQHVETSSGDVRVDV
ncbi:MAG TPA: hypothetical protein VHT05_10665 [Candidatus Elarobacter sp.]|jgi:hypothetical protein|nr:hypothetical protein [Candidatus Elarobacter sp.]